MKRLGWTIAVILVCPVLFVLGRIGLQRPTVPLRVDGKVVAVVDQPLFRPLWRTDIASVYQGDERLFSFAENYLLDGGPAVIYPFADGKRFFCDYDDDTARLDFVVDFTGAASNHLSAGWPSDAYVRSHLERRMTNVIFETKGVVRLPDAGERREVLGFLADDHAAKTEAYFGYGGRLDKEMMLLDLAADRQSVWPVKK